MPLSTSRPRRGRAAAAASGSARCRAAEEGVEEVGEGIGVPEHLLHFVGRHGPVGRAARATSAAGAARPSARLRTGWGSVLVGAPVGAELVVLPPLLRIAQDLMGFVDLLETGLRRSCLPG